MTIKVTPIRPALMNIKGIRAAILRAARAEGADLVKAYEQTTATWEGDKPTFKPQTSTGGGNASVKVGPTGNKEGVKKWGILNAGSPPHTIEAAKADKLAFQAEGFKAKTKPGKLKSGKGSPAGGQFTFVGSVNHPGSEARGWSTTILRQNKKRFPKRVNKAIKDVRKFK